jgi:hypothetical protein
VLNGAAKKRSILQGTGNSNNGLAVLIHSLPVDHRRHPTQIQFKDYTATADALDRRKKL